MRGNRLHAFRPSRPARVTGGLRVSCQSATSGGVTPVTSGVPNYVGICGYGQCEPSSGGQTADDSVILFRPRSGPVPAPIAARLGQLASRAAA